MLGSVSLFHNLFDSIHELILLCVCFLGRICSHLMLAGDLQVELQASIANIIGELARGHSRYPEDYDRALLLYGLMDRFGLRVANTFFCHGLPLMEHSSACGPLEEMGFSS